MAMMLRWLSSSSVDENAKWKMQAGTHLLQLTQGPLPDTALLEVVRRQLHHLLDDL